VAVTGTVRTVFPTRFPKRASARSFRWRRRMAATSLAASSPARTTREASLPGCPLMRTAEQASRRRAAGESAARPMRRFTPKTVFCGSLARCLSASAPTSGGPLFGKCTTLGMHASPRASRA